MVFVEYQETMYVFGSNKISSSLARRKICKLSMYQNVSKLSLIACARIISNQHARIQNEGGIGPSKFFLEISK